MVGAVNIAFPPQSIDAERAVLGALLIEGTAGYRRLAMLTRPDQFWVETNRVVFTAMQRLNGRGCAIDVLLVIEELKSMGDLDRVGGPAFLAGLEYEAAILTNLPDYERIVVDAASRRALLELGRRLEYESQNGTRTDAILLMAETALAEHRLCTPRGPRSVVPTELSQLLRHRFPPRVDLIGLGILPRRALLVLGGRTFLGKSLLLDNLVIQRAHGRPWLGFPTDPGITLTCSAEIKLQGVQERMAMMLAADSEPILEGRIHFHDDRGIKLDTPAGITMISQWIEETGATILRLDPLAKYMSTEENSTRDMGRVVDALEALADRYDLGVIVVHHEGHAAKDSGRTGGDRLRGSTALYAAADTVGMLSKDCDAYRLEWELRHARTPEPLRLMRDEALWYRPAGLSDEDKAVAKIVSIIGMTHDGLVGAIKEDTGASESTAKRRLKAALASGAIEKVDRHYIAGPAYKRSRVHEGSLGD